MFSWNSFKGMVNPLIKMLLILIIGHFIAVHIMKFVKRAFTNGKLDLSLSAFLAKTINIALHLLIILSALSSIGVSTGGILAAVSAAAVAVAVALKDSLGNVAGGILLLISPRFVTGDFIEVGGDSGNVINVDLLHTTIRTLDNKQVSIPNGVLINSHIVNYSREEKRRVDITFSISYEADEEKAKQIIMRTILEHPAVLREPEEPFVRVLSYGDSSVNITARSWCKTEDYWTVYFDLTEQVRASLEKNNITIPYNQLDVHITQNK